jgi:hypothetical protein
MTTPAPARSRALLPSLVVGAAIVGIVALAGWLLLLFVKGTVVLVSYGVGIALIVLPLLLTRRLLSGHTGTDRRHRIWTIAQAVGIGVALCVIAYFVGAHGWLLIAVPAAVVLVMRVVHGVTARKKARHPEPAGA